MGSWEENVLGGMYGCDICDSDERFGAPDFDDDDEDDEDYL